MRLAGIPADRCGRPARLRGRGVPDTPGLYGALYVSEEPPPSVRLLDLNEPGTLGRKRFRPSTVATQRREVTQDTARRLFARHPSAAGIRWWSMIEASWLNVTLVDLRVPGLVVAEGPRALDMGDALVTEAAAALGMI